MSEIAKKTNVTDIEAAAIAARMRGAGRFLLSDVLALLPNPTEEGLSERAMRFLESDDTVFCDGQESFIGRAEFFFGSEFVITPTEYEIEEGILYPGHRFSAFMSSEVFPSEVKFFENGSTNQIQTLERVSDLSEVFPYHILMGSEQVFDFFIAENPKNKKLADGAKATEKVSLQLFDLKKFYDKNNFFVGDALLCRVEDWCSGKFSFTYLSGEERNSADLRMWNALFDDALSTVIDKYDNFFDVPEQLTWAFYEGDDILRNGAKAASLDEYIKSTEAVEIGFDGGHASFVRSTMSDDGYLFDGALDMGEGVPEGVQVSSGETDSVSGLLSDIGVVVTAVEIDSYILDCCHFRELDFDSFFARCFGRDKLNYADDAQEAIFLNYLEDRWEEITGNYNRIDDEPKAPLRSKILEIIDEKSEFLLSIKDVEDAPRKLDEEEMHKLAELSLYLDELLRLLNSPTKELAEGEADELAETIAGVGDTQDVIIQKIEDNL